VFKFGNVITWYGNASGKNKIKLARVFSTASKLNGNEQKHPSGKMDVFNPI